MAADGSCGSSADVLGQNRVLAVHEHPLPKRKLRGESFVCAQCWIRDTDSDTAMATWHDWFSCRARKFPKAFSPPPPLEACSRRAASEAKWGRGERSVVAS